MQKETGRIYYLDILRILAIMAVVMIHMQTKWNSLPLDSFDWSVSTFLDSCCRWAVPVFFMISGALFLSQDRVLNICTLFSHNIFRLITAFFFWSFIYALSYQPDSLNTFIKYWIQGPFHFWFFFPIISIYMMAPILKAIAESPFRKYYFILAILFGSILPVLLENIPILFPDIYANPLCLSIYIDYHKFDFYPVLGYSFYFILGYALSQRCFSPQKSFLLKTLLPIGIILTYLLTKGISIKTGNANELFFDYFSFSVILESIGIFEFIKTLNIHLNKPVSQRIVISLSKYTFGIYLIHILILQFFEKNTQINNIPAHIFPFVIWPVIYLLSLLASMTLNHIPFLRKYIV